ncbi:MAG: HNH endonuclease [Candidatus Binatia bacterium]
MAAVDPYRSEIAHRAHYRCEYCSYPEAASSTPLEVDHIIPEARGGPTTLGNLALSCRSCNLHKHVKTEAIDPVTGRTASLFNPRSQQWPEHFALDYDTGELHGLTSVGRATVEALALNSAHAVATRQLLIRLGIMGR